MLVNAIYGTSAQKIKKAETAGQTRLNQPSEGRIPQTEQKVNGKFSLSDNSDVDNDVNSYLFLGGN
jgi:hypothetical protein